jgi:uncharacterized membrane protein
MSSPTPGQTNLGMAPNIASLLCYLPCCILGLLFSIVVVIVEKQSRFLRFHAFQSLLLHGVMIVLWFVVVAVQIGLAFVSHALSALFGLLSWGFVLAFLGVAIFLMIKANGNEEFQLPVIGEMAKKWAYGN